MHSLRLAPLFLSLCASLFTGLAKGADTVAVWASQNQTTIVRADGSAWASGGLYQDAAVQIKSVLADLGPLRQASANAPAWGLTRAGALYTFGDNGAGQVGNGTTEAVASPTRILDQVQAAAGYFTGNMAALRDDGTVWTWGLNRSGAAGRGVQGIQTTPQPIVGLNAVRQIAVGDGFGAALKADGTVWAWGPYWVAPNPDQPAEGYPFQDARFVIAPTPVIDLHNIVQIAASSQCLIALQSDGVVRVACTASAPEMGDLAHPGRAAVVHSVAGLGQVKRIAAGYSSVYALLEDGTVWGWGINRFGELGTGTPGVYRTPRAIPGISGAIELAAGSFHGVALRATGEVLGWGWNAAGQLGNGDVVASASAAPLHETGGAGTLNARSPAPSERNSAPSFGLDLSAIQGEAPLAVTAKALNLQDAEGDAASILWRASNGQTATGREAEFRFTSAGSFWVTAIATDARGAATLWTAHGYAAPAPQQVTTTPTIGFNGIAAAALDQQGRVYTWGAKWQSALLTADWNSPASAVPARTGIVGATQLAVGNGESYGLMADGSVLSWGANGFGQAGHSGQGDPYLPGTVSLPQPASAISSNGTAHALALLRDGTVWSWGSGEYGALGTGGWTTQELPQAVAGLPQVAQIGTGSHFSAALDAAGGVWTWGQQNWQWPDPAPVARNLPARIPDLPAIASLTVGAGGQVFAKARDGRVFGWGKELGAQPQEWPELQEFVAFSAGGEGCTLLQKADGSVWLWHACTWYQPEYITTPVLWSTIRSPLAWAQGGTGWGMVLADGTVLTQASDNTLGQRGDGTLASQDAPALVVNQDASAFLDLAPDISNVPPAQWVPPFLVQTVRQNSLANLSLQVQLRGADTNTSLPRSSARAAHARYQVYVAALIGADTGLYAFQLDAQRHWSALALPMAAYLSDVALNSTLDSVALDIFNQVDLSTLVGARIFVGYGTDAQEMLQAGRYREVMTLRDF